MLRITAKTIKRSLRFRVLNLARYKIGLTKAGIGHVLNPKSRTIRILLISDNESYTSEQQFAPFARYAERLRRKHGAVFLHMLLADGMRLDPEYLRRFDVVGLKFTFRMPSDDAERITRRFREQATGASTKLVYFDGDDDLCVQWPSVLKSVDLYVKKHVFSDTNAYLRTFIGKSNLTDYVARRFGASFDSNIIPRSGSIDPADLPKLYLGWNIGLDDKIAALFQKTKRYSSSAKDVDVVCRALVPETSWIFPMRNTVVENLEPIGSRFRLLLPTQRVSQEQYLNEMRRSRICVSPFGFGEICWRDFEAVLCGCLLVKPDVGHLRTIPDIFDPDVTYIPVRWDYSDLRDKCIYFLEHESERARIADKAYETLADYYRHDRFLDTFGGLIERLGLSRR